MLATSQEFLKDSFPITNSCSYLNTPSSGLISKKLLEFRKEYDWNIHHDYQKIDFIEDEQINTLREKIKQYFHGDAAEVALLPNFSIGINFIAEAIPKKSKVLLLKGDYPSVNFPFEKRDLVIDYATINEHLEENIRRKVEDFHPDYLVLSIVQYISGIKINIDFLKELKKQYPNLHILGDATQYLGTEQFNFDKSPFSAIGASGYKWFNAGTGNAFYLLKLDFIEDLTAKSIGSNSLLSKPNGPIRKVGFLEPGHFDMHSLKSLEVALDFHYKDIGIVQIERLVHQISSLAKIELMSRNLLEKEVALREEHSCIFNLKGDEALFKKLLDLKIICSLRGNGIRVGFQYFNNQADLASLMEVFDSNR